MDISEFDELEFDAALCAFNVKKEVSDLFLVKKGRVKPRKIWHRIVWAAFKPLVKTVVIWLVAETGMTASEIFDRC